MPIILLLLACPDRAIAAPIWISVIDLEGLNRTQARTILRELPFSIGSRWQPVFKTIGERRLRNLGLFSTVAITPPGRDGHVTIYLKERWSLYILPEATRSDSGRTSAGFALTEHNMWGLNHQLRLATRGDTGKNFSGYHGARVDVSYLWRRIADSPFSLDIGIAASRSQLDGLNAGIVTGRYKQRGKSWHGAVSRAFGPVPGEGWDASIGFSSNTSTYRLISGMPSPQPPLDQRINSLHSTVSYTLIDDHTTWLTGTLFRYALDVAHRTLGSDINVYRQSASLARHLPLPIRGGTLDMRLSGGMATGHVETTGLFDIGFSHGLRGYLPGELQGNDYLFANLEGRIPVSSGGNFQLVAFTDIGQVWNRGRHAFGKSLIVGIGGGARLTLRWLVKGTFRADIAYGAASKRWRFYFGTGQSF